MFQGRLRLLYAVLCAAFLLLAGRLVMLQVLQVTDVDPDYRLLPRPAWEETPAIRGTICDRNGVPLAVDHPVLNLAVLYKDLKGPEVRAAGHLAPSAPEDFLSWLDEVARLTGRDRRDLLDTREAILRRVERIRQTVLDQAARTGRRITRIREETIPHVLIRGVPLEVAARVEAAPERFPGVVILPDLARIYPHGSLAAHAIGYVTLAQTPPDGGVIREDPAILPGDRIGELGAERQWDTWLRGAPGYSEERADPRTGEIRRRVLCAARPGCTVRLTLDADAQRRTEAALAGHVGGAVALDIATGEVLVLAGAPSFDCNDLTEALRLSHAHPEWRLFVSKAARDSVAPGSIMKPIVALAAAAKGVVGAHTLHHCDGALRTGSRTTRCTGRHGDLDLAGAIEHSCNVWFFRTGLLTGAPDITVMAHQLGFGELTGIDLPFEWRGRVPVPGIGWSPGDTVNLSIGQGDMLATPLQAAVLMAAIATGGDIIRPRVLHSVDPPPEDYTPPGSPIVRHVQLPAAALAAIREGMERVPRTGTARSRPRLRALNVAAKTGTAETPDPESNHAWLAGYVPADRPRIAFAVAIHNTPKHGADAASPVVEEMLEALLKPAPAPRPALAPSTEAHTD